MSIEALKHKQFHDFKKMAYLLGFAKQLPAKIDLRTRVTMDLDGAQEGTAGYMAEFFEDTSSLLSAKTQDPKIKNDGIISADFLICSHALAFRFNQQLTTWTITELAEVLEKLSTHVLTIKNGTDIIFEKDIGFLLTGVAGYRISTDNAATPLVARGQIEPSKVTCHLEDPLIIPPGSTIKSTIHGATAWTTTDDLPVELVLDSWRAIKGSGADKVGSVMGLSDAIGRVKELGNVLAAAQRAA